MVNGYQGKVPNWTLINFASSEKIIKHNLKGLLLTLMKMVKDQSYRLLSRFAEFTPATKLKIVL